MADAIKREKNLKAWQRNWKIKLIEAMNLDWNDLQNKIDLVSTLVEYKPN